MNIRRVERESEDVMTADTCNKIQRTEWQGYDDFNQQSMTL